MRWNSVLTELVKEHNRAWRNHKRRETRRKENERRQEAWKKGDAPRDGMMVEKKRDGEEASREVEMEQRGTAQHAVDAARKKHQMRKKLH